MEGAYKEPVMKLIKNLVVLFIFLLPVSNLQARLLDKKILTLEAAEKVAAAAEAEAKKRRFDGATLPPAWETVKPIADHFDLCATC